MMSGVQPKWQFWAATALFSWISYNNGSIWPLIGWLVFCAVLILLFIRLHRWSREQDDKLAAEFPHDPVIQDRYGKDRH